MILEIINKKSGNKITLESYVKGNGVLITRFDPGTTLATFNKIKGIGQHGSTILSSTLEERIVEIEAIILSNDISEREVLKRNIDDVLNPLDSIIIKYYSNDVKIQIECCPDETPKYSMYYKTNNDNMLAFTVSFECFDPFWMDQDETILNVETWEGTFEFEFELTSTGIEFATKGLNELQLNNYGNVEAPLEVYFKGPALNPSITLNDGKFIKVNRTLADNEVLYICTAFGKKAVQVISNGEIEQAYHYIDIDSTFFSLDPGTNKISYSTEGDFLPQSVIIKYKCHYFSI